MTHKTDTLRRAPLVRAYARPTCGRRYRSRAKPTGPTPLPLFAWAAGRAVAAPRAALVLLPGCHDAEGQPRPALLIPGRRVPLAFRSMAAALAAQRTMEAGR